MHSGTILIHITAGSGHIRILHTMDDLKNKGPQDRTRVALGEEWEIQWWTKRFGVSADKLRQAVKAVGNSADKVQEYLAKN